jgi:DinB family protein
MRNRSLCLAALLALACCTALIAPANAAGQHTVAQVLNASVTGAEKELMSAADAMPADKFSFVPSTGEFKGVRTFAEQLRHIAAVNYILGAAILVEKAPVDTGGESGPASIQSKADIIKYASDSFVYLHKALDTISEKNMLAPVKYPFGDAPSTRLALAVNSAQHIFDHYGQMVEYLRLNGIVPPASR